ncbi:MAG: hypothetical protein EBR30_19010 [Cytophagia bacterium]|nr:hypothetical protein [Cytophagia bacterium]
MFKLSYVSFITLFFLLGLSIIAEAQKSKVSGYIVSIKGDTIKGLFSKKSQRKQYTQCVFSAVDSKEMSATKYLPFEITGYGYGDRIYQTRKIKVGNDSVSFFYNLLTGGKVSLLRGRDFLYVSTDTSADIFPLKRLNMLYYIMRDCKEIKSELDKVKKQEENLMEVVRRFHNCIGDSSYKIYQPPMKSAINLSSVISGYDYSSLSFPSFNTTISGELSKVKFRANYSPIIGLGWEFFPATRHKQNVSLNMQLQLTRILFQGEYRNEDINTYTYDNILHRYLAIRLPIQIRQKLTNFGRVDLFASIGATYSINTMGKSKYTFVRGSGGQLFSDEFSIPLYAKGLTTASFSIGCKYDLANRLLTTELKYDSMFIKDDFNQDILQLIIGFSLRRLKKDAVL